MNSPEAIIERIELLREGLPDSIRSRKSMTGSPVIGVFGDVIPCEVLRAKNMLPLKIPSYIFSGRAGAHGASVSGMEGLGELYDWLIVPREFRSRAAEVFPAERTISLPRISGFGEKAAEALHEYLKDTLDTMGGGGVREIDDSLLQTSVREYNELRRTVRGISLVRADRPGMLSHRDLHTVFEAAMILPPETIMDELSCLLDCLNDLPAAEDARPRAMAAGGYCPDWSVLDKIEQRGCLIIEDDFADGRRQFDLTLDETSEHLYYEVLGAYSYKAFPFGVRPAAERFELVYSQLKNYGIELVFFLMDSLGPEVRDGVELLRVQLMRSGIDPVPVSGPSAAGQAGEYLREVYRSAERE